MIPTYRTLFFISALAFFLVILMKALEAGGNCVCGLPLKDSLEDRLDRVPNARFLFVLYADLYKWIFLVVSSCDLCIGQVIANET